MKKGILIFLVFSILSFPTLAFSANKYKDSRKDPILAGALSWYVPGLGQLYSGKLLKGAAFFVIEEALLIGTILSFAEIKLDVSGDINIGLNIKSKAHADRDEQKIGVILGAALIVVHFANVIDAVNTSRKYNQSIENDFYTEFNFNQDESKYTFGFSYRL